MYRGELKEGIFQLEKQPREGAVAHGRERGGVYRKAFEA